ncbi:MULTISPECIES: Ger(x)C family spore germination protein [Pseudobacteroides]|uniref:Germination protein, Ger(X)C family n=2 Tax=Oscillospiraceae TaxID=216572 RepID=A0A0L6JTR7_9FIRM|nr:Ger(x)C family spore germination protein [Pseudobacteroides cellulosolvens]KNY29085.1 germination protein, Ger(x)C family [Pseudobacteroides cellulosolvens ATCC 35603 = DSM 2933]
MPMKKTGLLLIFILFAALLTSCYDAREVTDTAYVQFIGIDRGVKDKWRLTLKIATHSCSKDSSGSGGAQPAESKSVTIDAPSFYGGVNLLNTNVPQKLEFAHAKLLVISEDLAQSGLVGEYIAPLIRFREIRRTLDVVVSQGSAQDFVEKTEPYLGGSPIAAIEDLTFEAENTSYFPHVTLNDFYNAVKSTYRQPVVTLGGLHDPANFQQNGEKWGSKFNLTGRYFAGEVPRKGGNSIEFLGSALFDGDRMVGKLDGHDTRMMLLARGDFQRGIFTIQDPKAPELIIPIELQLSRKPQIKVSFEGAVPLISLALDTEGDILAIQSRINYEKPDMLPLLEKAVGNHLKKSLDEVISKCQALNCDTFFFGRTAVRHFWTIEEWEAYHWNKHFKEAKVSTKVKFKIRRTGGLLKSSEIVTSEGKE